MRALITLLYVVGFLMLVDGFRRLLLIDREVRAALASAAAAGSGVAPPGEIDWQFAANHSAWGPAAARLVGEALQLTQEGQTKGAVLALIGGALGLTATLLALWA